MCSIASVYARQRRKAIWPKSVSNHQNGAETELKRTRKSKRMELGKVSLVFAQLWLATEVCEDVASLVLDDMATYKSR